MGIVLINIALWAKTTYLDPAITIPRKAKAKKELEGSRLANIVYFIRF